MSTFQPVPPVIAHRGASGHAPENTLAAIRKAHDLGARWVEFDCMLTRDGHAILHHDDTLERVTGHDLNVAEVDLADLAHLDAGSWFAPEYAGEAVPTLHEAIALLGALGMGANVELKPAPGHEAATGETVARDLAAHWPAHLPPPVISGFSEASLRAARPLLPGREFALLVEAIPEDWPQRLEALGATALHASAAHLTGDGLASVVEAGAPLRCYTVNDRAHGEALFAAGVASIFTDFPDRFADWLDRR